MENLTIFAVLLITILNVSGFKFYCAQSGICLCDQADDKSIVAECISIKEVPTFARAILYRLNEVQLIEVENFVCKEARVAYQLMFAVKCKSRYVNFFNYFLL